jgi:hypothetical protein
MHGQVADEERASGDSARGAAENVAQDRALHQALLLLCRLHCNSTQRDLLDLLRIKVCCPPADRRTGFASSTLNFRQQAASGMWVPHWGQEAPASLQGAAGVPCMMRCCSRQHGSTEQLLLPEVCVHGTSQRPPCSPARALLLAG